MFINKGFITLTELQLIQKEKFLMDTQERKVTLEKITKNGITQYWVCVNGRHIEGGCITDFKEAEKFFDFVCSDKWGQYSKELLKEKTV